MTEFQAKSPAMKTIGVLGGMSTASTLQYYELLCRLTAERLGGLHSPRLLIRSVDFGTVAHLQNESAWGALGEMLATRAEELERGGAELLVLATNTMHKVVPRMMRDVTIPLVHIADATAERILAGGFSHPGLIGTQFTMEDRFYLDRLRGEGLQPIVPEYTDRAHIHAIIYEELCRHDVRAESRDGFIAIAERLKQMGADCLILGCTEVGLLLSPDNSPLPVFDTTQIHCEAALNVALESPET
ncbi:aspartate racemase [Algimonas ampicilliniresistens]|uniref:Aspartate racemase n=2 Tax=Algimonas ampicilliniresistens TaxID=1298735 RepID=A0ABQ5VBS2_9PROT|nr:aspartate/glutamate racemase family protein [Algimonas ampicilliniresistens]GLQ23842.1 aspartate racemase [Algimonas ampicilliniresistens]